VCSHLLQEIDFKPEASTRECSTLERAVIVLSKRRNLFVPQRRICAAHLDVNTSVKRLPLEEPVIVPREGYSPMTREPVLVNYPIRDGSKSYRTKR